MNVPITEVLYIICSAHPGPVCYRKEGGLLSVTDANVVLGRIMPDYFPHIFGPTENQPLDYEAAYNVLNAMTTEINSAHDGPDKR